jgi:hypothetical protein
LQWLSAALCGYEYQHFLNFYDDLGSVVAAFSLRMSAIEGERNMADSLAQWLVYYGQAELADLVAELVEATTAIDLAFERQAHAIEALSDGWQAPEAKRMARCEAENVEQAA